MDFKTKIFILFVLVAKVSTFAATPLDLKRETHIVSSIKAVDEQFEQMLNEGILFFMLDSEVPNTIDKIKAIIQRTGTEYVYLLFRSDIANSQIAIGNFNKIDKILKIEDNEVKYYDENIDLSLYWLTDSNLRDYRSLVEFWIASGRRPNFLITKSKLSNAKYSLKYLNATQKVSSTVVDGAGYSVADVHWNEFPKLTTKGEFSIPYEPNSRLVLSPYKHGYRFSPDIVYFTEKSCKITKIFRAYKLKIFDDLINHVDFNGSAVNKITSQDFNTISHNVKFQSDRERGLVGVFDGETSFVDCGSEYSFDDEFTLSAWIKPQKLDEVFCIVAKGLEFNLKLIEGNLSFTHPEIADYKSDFYKFVENEWRHVAITYVNSRELRFYVDGALVGSKKIESTISKSNYSLLIGNNLWDEYFKGAIDNVLIWNRVLNSNEIRDVYNIKPKKEPKSFGYVFLFIGLIVLSAIVFLFRFGKIKNKQKHSKTDEVIFEIPKTAITQEKIEIFGDFYLTDSEGVDISAKFSPMLKKLFLVFFFHSVDQDGISSQKLTEILWPDYTFKSAKNTRGTNIQKLRNLLSKNKGVKIDFVDKKWILSLDENIVFCDYLKFLTVLAQNENSKNIDDILTILPELISLTKQGRIVSNIKDGWLDPYLESITNLVVDFYMEAIQLLDIDKHQSIVLCVSDVLLLFDSVNETALTTKIKILNIKGQHGAAKLCVDHFKNEYFALYGEVFSKDI